MIIKNLEIDSVGLEEYASVPLDGAEHVNRIASPISSRVSDGPASGTGTVLSSSETFALEGWSFHKNGCDSFEYRIDGGEWLPLRQPPEGHSSIRFMRTYRLLRQERMQLRYGGSCRRANRIPWRSFRSQ